MADKPGFDFSFILDPSLESLDAEILRELFQFWRRLRGDRTLPSRTDFRPETLPKNLIASLALADVIPGDVMDFQWRVIGTEITSAMGRDITGRYFSDVYGSGRRDLVTPTFQHIAEQKLPLRWHGNAKFADKSWVEFEALGLPLSDDDSAVNKILVGFAFEHHVE